MLKDFVVPEDAVVVERIKKAAPLYLARPMCLKI
jgi:hypothetical protein